MDRPVQVLYLADADANVSGSVAGSLVANAGYPLKLHAFDSCPDRQGRGQREPLLRSQVPLASYLWLPRKFEEGNGAALANLALHTFGSHISWLPAEDRQFVAIVSGRFTFSPTWLSQCVDLLTDDVAVAEEGVAVVCPMPCEHEFQPVKLAERGALLTQAAFLGVWVTTWDFFARHGWPPPGAHPVDFYAASMSELGERFAFFAAPPVGNLREVN